MMLVMDTSTSRLMVAGRHWPADVYEEGRPDYPAELLDRLHALHALDQGTAVLDLAAGTGKLTRLLTTTGCDVIAVEPSDQMRAVLGRELPSVDVRGGGAEAIPLGDRSVDVVVVGEAFHWFDAPAAWRELARVVRPGGLVLAAWLHRNVTSWQAQITNLLRPYLHAVPHADVQANPALPGFPGSAFTDVTRWSIVYEQPYTVARLRRMYESYSFISILDHDERAGLLDEIEGVVRDGADVADDTFSLPLQLDTWSTTRR